VKLSIEALRRTALHKGRAEFNTVLSICENTSFKDDMVKF